MALAQTALLTREVTELRAASQRRRQKQDIRRRYIAHGGALQAQAGQQLVEQLDNMCYIQGHNRRQCTTI
ncbi:hypothetical protein M501DRAFT_1020070 [Patellaria atrata CBS 101060]|uniref:Uncharacterized protein n=1 Tax=Patellaria atrata CBS 101060 TaxID=1346257 RepID=A0A9P4S2Z2_9PEZI|nr:hypothetical protein M501DRAFT_1020070 [Patellaria atrata CBS 101060]